MAKVQPYIEIVFPDDRRYKASINADTTSESFVNAWMMLEEWVFPKAFGVTRLQAEALAAMAPKAAQIPYDGDAA